MNDQDAKTPCPKREAHNAAWRAVRYAAYKNPAFDTPPELLAKYMEAFKGLGQTFDTASAQPATAKEEE